VFVAKWCVRGTALIGASTTPEWMDDLDQLPEAGLRGRLGAATSRFDSSKGVLFGGYSSNTGNLGDTWEYYTRGATCSTDATCDVGYCVDGVCCETFRCGTCQSCETPIQMPASCPVLVPPFAARTMTTRAQDPTPATPMGSAARRAARRAEVPPNALLDFASMDTVAPRIVPVPAIHAAPRREPAGHSQPVRLPRRRPAARMYAMGQPAIVP
jgi:hypothetical protein